MYLDELFQEISTKENNIIKYFIVSEKEIKIEKYEKKVYEYNEKLPETFYVGCVYKKISKYDFPIYFVGQSSPYKKVHLFGENDAKIYIENRLQYYITHKIEPYFALFKKEDGKLDYIIEKQIMEDSKNKEKDTIFEYNNISYPIKNKKIDTTLIFYFLFIVIICCINFYLIYKWFL